MACDARTVRLIMMAFKSVPFLIDIRVQRGVSPAKSTDQCHQDMHQISSHYLSMFTTPEPRFIS